MATIVEQPVGITTPDKQHCFVCDVVVTGLCYPLSTCVSQSTKIKLMDKLDDLVGDSYMVVVNDNDIICRGCTNLMNILDRLEIELSSVRNVILRFLERKYSLEEGELVSNYNSSLPSARNTNETSSSAEDTESSTENSMAKKRKAALKEIEKQTNSVSSTQDFSKGKEDKPKVWLQCDKCKYMTHYNAFMLHHVRQHYKKDPPKCNLCGGEVGESNKCVQDCQLSRKENSNSGNSNSIQNAAPKNKVTKSVTENINLQNTVKRRKCPSMAVVGEDPQNSVVEMHKIVLPEQKSYAPSVTEPAKSPDILHLPIVDHNIGIIESDIVTVEEGVGVTVEGVGVTVEEGVGAESTDDMVTNVIDSLPLRESESLDMTLDNQTPSSLCVMDISNMETEDQTTLLTMDKIETDESGEMYVQVVEMGDTNLETPVGATKQLLTVTEDGRVQMVEVMWDPDIVTEDMDSHEVIQF